MSDMNKTNFAAEKRKAIAKATHQSKTNKVLIGFLALSSGLSLFSGGLSGLFYLSAPSAREVASSQQNFNKMGQELKRIHKAQTPLAYDALIEKQKSHIELVNQYAEINQVVKTTGIISFVSFAIALSLMSATMVHTKTLEIKARKELIALKKQERYRARTK